MSADDSINPFASLSTRADVATFLATSVKQLSLLLQGRAERQRYTQFTIPKRRGGTRSIHAPRQDLKILQLKLAKKLNLVYRPRNVVFGFVEDRGIVENAERHIACRYVLNVDLKDFFPSINFGRVLGLFLALKASKTAATVLAQICCHEGKLPQGAPTSPVISNMICLKLDRMLSDLAKDYHCKYSRYADDLTFSLKRGTFPPEIAHIDETDGRAILGKKLRDIIEGNGFTPHSDKTWLFSRLHRQMVTGLVVNSKKNVPRQFVRQLRAMIHAWEVFGLEKAQAEYHAKYRKGAPNQNPPPFDSVVRGKMEFLKMVKGIEDGVYRNLQRRLVKADESYFSVMEKENNLMKKRDVFISHASEDKKTLVKELADKLIAAGITVWYDEYEVILGDDLLHKIDEGLVHSQFGVIVFSPFYFAAKKTWTLREYSALVAGEDVDKAKRIIPVWHNITREELYKKSPIIVNRLALRTGHDSIDEMEEKIVVRVRQG